MTYYAKERRLQIGVYERVFLTDGEDYILSELIKKGRLEIEKDNSLRVQVTRLRKKTGLRIRSLAGVGYVLDSEVYWEEGTNG